MHQVALTVLPCMHLLCFNHLLVLFYPFALLLHVLCRGHQKVMLTLVILRQGKAVLASQP